MEAVDQTLPVVTSNAVRIEAIRSLCDSIQSEIFSEHFEEISEHSIFHGITAWYYNKPLNIKYKNGLLIIGWE